MRKIFALLFLAGSFQCYAQESIGDIMKIAPGKNYPNDMPNIQKWITHAVGTKKTINDFRNIGPGGKNFSFTDTRPITVVFPGTNGIKLSFKSESKKSDGTQASQTLALDAQLPILEIDHDFNPSKLSYTAKEYFDTTIKAKSVSGIDLISGAVKLLPRNPDKNKMMVLIDTINSFYHAALPYPKTNTEEGIADVLSKSKYDLTLFYDVFIDDASEETSLKKLNTFYKKVYTFSEDATKQIDELRIYNIKVTMHKQPETLDFPVSIANPGTSTAKPTALKFLCNDIEANLDYKNKSLSIIINSKIEQSVTLVNAFKSKVTIAQTSKGTTRTEEWIPVKNEVTMVKQFVIVVTESSVTVLAKGNAKIYKLVENKNN